MPAEALRPLVPRPWITARLPRWADQFDDVLRHLRPSGQPYRQGERAGRLVDKAGGGGLLLRANGDWPGGVEVQRADHLPLGMQGRGSEDRIPCASAGIW